MNEKLAIKLFKSGIPIFGEFKFKLHETYPNAPLFLMKLNLRQPPRGNLSKELFVEIAKRFYGLATRSGIIYNLVAGLPRAGDRLARDFVNIHPGLTLENLVFLEKEEKPHRRKILHRVIGRIKKGEIVLVIDDVISLANTKVEGVEVLRLNGLIVKDCLIFMDWELGGADILAEHGVRPHAVCTVSKLLAIWRNNGFLLKEQCETIINRKNEIREYIEQHQTI